MIKLYNTLTNKLQEFKPLVENEVKMYVCGPTVYNYIHIGNARPAIFFDTVRRYFEYRGYKVTYVQNFTDVDDKMINKAIEEKVTVKEIADKYIKAYFEDTGKVNLKEEGMIRPKATEHIPEMISIVKKLIQNDYAYEINGDVYFNVEKYKGTYGELSKQKVEDLKAGARVEINKDKRSSVDFALWKSTKDGTISWDSPWGEGRPGWHLECSAMSSKYLGETFDIHGGGQDLIFPHHENEIAQSKCSTDGEYARYWMHNGYINIKGEKMSKSLGNFFLLREVLEKYEGKVVRFFVLGSHYRKPIDFSDVELEQAKSAIERIENSIIMANEKIEETINTQDTSEQSTKAYEILKAQLEESKSKFIEGMDDDFNTSKGIGAVFELVKEMNKYMKNETLIQVGKEVLKESIEFIKEVLIDVLGVEIKFEKNIENNLTSELVEYILELRKDAKTEKRYDVSDAIRDRLKDLGIEIKDGRDKTSWEIK